MKDLQSVQQLVSFKFTIVSSNVVLSVVLCSQKANISTIAGLLVLINVNVINLISVKVLFVLAPESGVER